MNEDEILKQTELNILVEVDRFCAIYEIPYSLAYGTLLGAVRHKGFIPWDDDIDICMLRSDYNRFLMLFQKHRPDGFFLQTHETDRNYLKSFAKIRMNGTIFQEKIFQGVSMHQGIYIDIFPYDYVPKNFFLRKLGILLSAFYYFLLEIPLSNALPRRDRVITNILSTLIPARFHKNLYNACYKNLTGCPRDRAQGVGALTIGYCNAKIVHPLETFEKLVKLPFEKKVFSAVEDYDSFLTLIYGDYCKLPPEDCRKSGHDIVEIRFEMRR